MMYHVHDQVASVVPVNFRDRGILIWNEISSVKRKKTENAFFTKGPLLVIRQSTW